MNISKRSIKSGIFHVCIIIGAVLFFGFFTIVEARHLKLYGPKRPEKGVTWVTYTNDFIPSSVVPSSAGDVGNVLFHEIEIETGITDRWSQSVYFDGDTQFESPDSHDNNTKLTLIKTEFNFAVFESNFFDFRLNNEWAFNTGNYSDPLAEEKYSDSIELRPIFSKSIHSFTLIVGPGFFYRYTEEPRELTYFYANAIQYSPSDKVTIGLEFHGDLGGLRTSSEHSHFLVPNIDIQLHEKILLSIGIGIGLNDQSEDYVFRNSLQFSYQW
ncbi:MAG: hypothetical protein L3J17_15750 [Candidatus Jettenia sp.]|nr:MAG: hypothetical protein L3J17_15750 [Candidatus Jettenia sp.]